MTALQTTPNAGLPIGFRKKIAADFGRKNKHAAGVVFVAPDGDILLLRRSNAETNFAGHWALPGGKGEEGESPEDTAVREAGEEIAGMPEGGEAEGGFDAMLKPLDARETPNGMTFHTFALPVPKKFTPKLNDEHSGYAWASLDMLPRPLHPAVEQTLKEQVGIAEDMDLPTVRDGFVKWSKDRDALVGDSALCLALDRDSVRKFDRDGRLRVARTHISKANVCPYKGSEIPDWQKLGLDPEKIYQLLRHPEELEKAAPSLNGVPLLRKHIPVSADDHQPHDVVGSLGTDAEFDGEYLDNSLFVNARDAIDGIESGKKRELSAGYHYRPDMTPGIFRGKAFDGVMRDIEFNHVALVEDGRAGPDVVVGDSTENLPMKSTRLAALALMSTAAHVSPRLAMDIALPKTLFLDITSKNFKAKTPEIVAALKTAVEGKLRPGMALDDAGLTKLLNALEETTDKKVADESVSEEQHKAMEAAAHGESDIGIPKSVAEEFVDKDKGKTFDAEPVKAFLREKGMSEDDITALSSMLPTAAAKDEDADEAEEKAKREAEEAAKKTKEAEDAMKDMVTKPAMDAAIKAATEATAKSVRETERGIRDALETVKPWVGTLSPSLALDSATDVYRHAAIMLGVAGAKDLHPDALLPIIKAQRQPGARPAEHSTIALDAATVEGFAKRFPEAQRISHA